MGFDRLNRHPTESDPTSPMFFLQSVMGLLAGNLISSDQLRIGHKPDLDQPMDTPKRIPHSPHGIY